jgi:hypothetical protein
MYTYIAEKDRSKAVLFAYEESASDLVTFSFFSGKLEQRSWLRPSSEHAVPLQGERHETEFVPIL